MFESSTFFVIILAMKKKVFYCFLFFIVVVLFSLAKPVTVWADLIMPGTKEVHGYYNISNMADYSNYIFFSYTDWPQEHIRIIKPGQKFSFYKFSTPSTLCATKKENFSGGKKLTLEALNQGNYQVVCSKLLFPSLYQTVGENNPLDKVEETIKIISLGKRRLRLLKTKTTYFYEDGSSKTKVVSRNDLIRLGTLFINFWYIVLPSLSLIGIIVILFSRKTKT